MSKKQAIHELLDRKRTSQNVNANTGIQVNGDTAIQGSVQSPKKKATFELDMDLHKKLKIYAASRNLSMVDVVEQALREHFDRN